MSGSAGPDTTKRRYPTKAEVYAYEQSVIVARLFLALELDDFNSITKRKLDEDKDKQKNILELAGVSKKFFKMPNFLLSKPGARPYWSLVKAILKNQPVTIVNKTIGFRENGQQKRTQRYTFICDHGWSPRYDLVPVPGNSKATTESDDAAFLNA